MPGAWTCPRCGVAWTEPICRHCVAAPVQWGPPRPFGALFGGAFALFGAHWEWILRLSMLATIACVPFLLWFVNTALEYHRRTDALLRALQRDIFALNGQTGRPETDDGAGMFIFAGAALLLVSMTTQAFFTAAIFRTLATRRIGERVSLGTAFTNGVSGCWSCLTTGIWLLIRSIPWFLLLVIPGIVKVVAWSMALPARLSGDAQSAEGALAASDSASRGRRLYLFGFIVLMSLIGKGVDQALNPILKAFLRFDSLGPALALMAVHLVFAMMVGAVTSIGCWLAWADAVSPNFPGSRAIRDSAVPPVVTSPSPVA